MHIVLLSGDTLDMLAVVTDIAEASAVCFILREIAIVLLLDKRFAALILHIVEQTIVPQKESEDEDSDPSQDISEGWVALITCRYRGKEALQALHKSGLKLGHYLLAEGRNTTQ